MTDGQVDFTKAIHDAVETELNGQLGSLVPEGHTTAVVASITGHGSKLIVARRLNDKWEVDGSVEHPGGFGRGAIQAGVTLKGSW